MAEKNEAYIAALLRERAALERTPGEEHRLAEIDGELERAGYKPDKPERKAEPQGRKAPDHAYVAPNKAAK
jgi:hypothetical protein